MGQRQAVGGTAASKHLEVLVGRLSPWVTCCALTPPLCYFSFTCPHPRHPARRCPTATSCIPISPPHLEQPSFLHARPCPPAELSAEVGAEGLDSGAGADTWPLPPEGSVLHLLGGRGQENQPPAPTLMRIRRFFQELIPDR